MVLPGETIATGGPTTCSDCNATPELQVCSSPAGFYIGTYCACGPYSRESEYFKTHEQAKKALDSGEFSR